MEIDFLFAAALGAVSCSGSREPIGAELEAPRRSVWDAVLLLDIELVLLWE